MMAIEIRKATFNDIEEIYNLVRELAIYEDGEHMMSATLEDYQTDFLDEQWDSTVAIDSGCIIGMTIYFNTYSTWKGRMFWLEDFIVTEEYRRSGVGQRLWDAIIKEAKERNCVMMKWQVLDWNKPALHFYEKNQAIIEKDWWNGKIIF
ncbi:MAG: GNAT family N-acetyltransferase [Bacteroidia bacterium]|nr:GNAT family N-acetyltransferase [Bacteroidia bacterium]